MGFLDDAADSGLIGGLTSFGNGFLGGMKDAEDRKYKRMEFEAKKKAAETEIANKQFDNELNVIKAGKKLPPAGQPVDLRNLENDPEYIDNKIKVAQAGATYDPFGSKAVGAEAAKQGLIKAQVEAEEKARKKRSSPVKGYQKGDDYVADPVEERGLRTGSANVIKFNNILESLKTRVQNAPKTALANPTSNEAKAIQNDLRDLQLLYKSKDFADLGVLAGPDLSLLEQVIENPGSLSNLYSGKAGVLDRYNQLQQKVKSGFDTRAKSYGLLPAEGGGGDELEAKKKRLEELRMKASQ